MTESPAPGVSAMAGSRPGLLTSLGRSAARGLRACAARLTSRRRRLPSAAKLVLAALFIGPFCLGYGLLRLRVRRRGHLTEECTAAWGSRFEVRLPDMVQLYVYLFGVWEPDLTSFIWARLRPGDTFVDVGANIGYHALLAAQRVGGAGRVAAIEASPAMFRMLQANLALNDGTERVRAVNMAASDARGSVRMHRGPACNLGQSTMLESRGFGPEAEVAAAPLADLLEPREIETARLVKIDVEGAEDRVLAGMRGFLERCPAEVEILVELSPTWWPDAHQTPQQVLAPLFEAGFHAYRIDNNLWPWRYLWPNDVCRPRRIREPLVKRVKRIDLVLSRLDRDQL